MKITEDIISATIKQIVSGIFGILILLIGSIYPDIIPAIFRYLIQNLSKEVLLKITSLAILLTILLACLSLAIYLKYRNKLKPKCGVWWDKDKEAYCPHCKTLLSGYTEMPPNAYYFKCHGHNENVFLLDDKGKAISIKEARKLL